MTDHDCSLIGWQRYAEALQIELNTAKARIAELEAERDEETAIRERLAELLAKTVVALRGPEPPLTRWSYHDIPELVLAAVEDAARYRWLRASHEYRSDVTIFVLENIYENGVLCETVSRSGDGLDAAIDTARAETAEARIAELEADAARYRWLRDADNWCEAGPAPCVATCESVIYGTELDAAIDAARAATKDKQ